MCLPPLSLPSPTTDCVAAVAATTPAAFDIKISIVFVVVIILMFMPNCYCKIENIPGILKTTINKKSNLTNNFYRHQHINFIRSGICGTYYNRKYFKLYTRSQPACKD